MIIFAFIALPVMVLAGGALDYSKALQSKAELQNLIDAAILAGSTRLNIDSDADIKKKIRDFVDVNSRSHSTDGKITINSIDIDQENGKVSVKASTWINTNFLRLIGINQLDMKLRAEAAIGNKTFEIALVLDNSGSMAGSKIEDLQTAAKGLTQIMFGEKANHPNINIGVVPFSGLVNVGSQHSDASWMDKDGSSSIHRSTFTGTKTRFDIYNEMNNVSWRGCVETRAAPYDVDDTEPTTNDTLFVPSLAVDAPDNNINYLNTYIDDNGGSCEGKLKEDKASCATPNSPSCSSRQEKTCKYEGATPDMSLLYGTRLGPNYLCDTEPLTPLSNVKSTINSAFGDMDAYGGTNIHLGVAWGWRILSPGEPFTEGAAYNTINNTKIMIVMSDGANMTLARDTHVGSTYSAYGYYSDGRLGASAATQEAMEEAMDDKTLKICTNAKNAGITIYTVAFEVENAATLAMLSSCATSPSMAFQSSSGDELIATFEDIATKINMLHLSK